MDNLDIGVKEIKVVCPGDKLLIMVKGIAGSEEFIKARELITRWLNSGHILFVGENCEVFLVKENCKIELRRKLNDDLKKSQN